MNRNDIISDLIPMDEEDMPLVAQAEPGIYARAKMLLSLRRQGKSFSDIAEKMGYSSPFEVVDALNELHRNSRPISINVIKYDIDSHIDDIIAAHKPIAMEGETKSANVVLKALELRAKLHGAITPPQVNVQVNNRPWESVYEAILVDKDATEVEVIEDDTEDRIDDSNSVGIDN